MIVMIDPKAKDGAVPKDKFRGPAALFEALDRDGDGKVTPNDLDWSDPKKYPRVFYHDVRFQWELKRGAGSSFGRDFQFYAVYFDFRH